MIQYLLHAFGRAQKSKKGLDKVFGNGPFSLKSREMAKERERASAG
jgi:hypothetical protein